MIEFMDKVPGVQGIRQGQFFLGPAGTGPSGCCCMRCWGATPRAPSGYLTHTPCALSCTAGAPIHWHSAAVNALFYGRKRWVLTPPRDSMCVHAASSPRLCIHGYTRLGKHKLERCRRGRLVGLAVP